MSWIELNIHWIPIVTGALTSTIASMIFAPRFAFNLLFGEAPLEPSAVLVVRSFAAMIFGGIPRAVATGLIGPAALIHLGGLPKPRRLIF